jgi:hypothetical protein
MLCRERESRWLSGASLHSAMTEEESGKVGEFENGTIKEFDNNINE